MRCLKCKKEIADDVLRCSYCNTKVRTVCPVCGTKNPITAEYCEGCGLQLLKYCPQCGCVNLPNALKCRKCSNAFESDDSTISISDLQEAFGLVNPENNISKTPVSDNQKKETVDEYSQKSDENINAEENSFQIDSIDTDETPIELDKISEFNAEVDMEPVEPIEPLEFGEIDEFKVEELEDTQLADIEENKNIDETEIKVSKNFDAIEENTLPEKDELDEKTITTLLDLSDTENNLMQNEMKEQDVVQDDSDDTHKTQEEKSPETEQNIDASKNVSVEIEKSDKEQNPQKIQKEDTAEPEDTSEKEKTVSAEEKQSDAGDISLQAYDQMKCKNLVVNSIRRPDKLIIGLSAPEGSGKSTVLKYLFGDLMHENYAWLWGECSANSQISPFGIFQEMVLTFFNMPNFSNMSQDFFKQAKTMLSQTFPAFSQEEIFNLFNFLYPSLTANFEEILVNKDTTFALLEKLIIEISKKAKLIIVIDDFDMIDGASYEFLSKFVDKGYLSESIKLIITYKDNRITQGYFYSETIAQNQYEDIRLAKLTKTDADNLVKMFFNGTNPLPQELFDRIYEYSSGNSAYIEQVLVLLNEYNAFVQDGNKLTYKQTQFEEKLPSNIYEILTFRLNYLEEKQPMAFRTLCTAAIMGNKFNIRLLEIIMKLSAEEFQNIIQLLTVSAYVAQFNPNIFEFKNTILWKFIYERAKQNKAFTLWNEKIFDIINSFNLSSNALKALVAQNLNQKLLALNIWTENIKLCAYLGDEHLWALSQKQCLKIAQEIDTDNNEIIINNIQERLGKLLYKSKPSEAIPFLSNAISNAIKIDNRPKIIELSGYLSKSCSLTGNYYGVIEAVDTILKYMETPFNKLETALVKYKKLKAMFCIGNAEEIFNLASNEIIPVVEQALSGVISNNDISMNVIYETWLECNLTVAMSLISQGSKKAFDILSVIDEIVAKNNVDNKNYLQRVKLAKALAFCIQGNIKKSEDILVEFTQETSKEIVAPEIISMWNFINILNKLYKRDWQNIKEDMYSVVTFANNYNDVLVKNLLKVFLGKILQEEGNLAKALDIFNEQVTIFAREKIAIGALLCWYYIAKLTLITEGTDKSLEITQKALDVAKNPKISNYYFMVLYKKLLAEIYLIKGDTEASKMYIEKALMIVKQYDMKLLKISLYQLYAKYLEEMAKKKPQNQATFAQNAITTYKKALALIADLGTPLIEEDIKKDFTSFKTYCQLNNIKV